VIEEVELQCFKAKLKKPGANTVRRRIAMLSERLKLEKRKGRKAAAAKYKAKDRSQRFLKGSASRARRSEDADARRHEKAEEVKHRRRIHFFDYHARLATPCPAVFHGKTGRIAAALPKARRTS
jgi:hypothetical protein